MIGKHFSKGLCGEGQADQDLESGYCQTTLRKNIFMTHNNTSFSVLLMAHATMLPPRLPESFSTSLFRLSFFKTK